MTMTISISMTMQNLGSLVRELRDIIAAASSPTPSDHDALELRFRTILLDLLHTHVLPSSSGNLTLTFLQQSPYLIY